MSNFEIFNKKSLAKLIEPFIQGMTDYITPIKYEAITPDIFALLFRTTGNSLNGKPESHYFISLEFDYIESLQAAKESIEEWHGGKVIEFIYPVNNQAGDDPHIKVNKTYQALLARVERPLGSGYWANNEVIYSPDEIEELVSKLDDSIKNNVRTSLVKIFKEHPGASVSVYVRPNGRVELFFG